jgi:hypothetical protein
MAVIVHDCKLKVDGIHKYLDNTAFQFDHTFHEENTTEEVYLCAVQPLIDFVIKVFIHTSMSLYAFEYLFRFVCSCIYI